MSQPDSLAEVARRRVADAETPLWKPLGEFLDAFYDSGADRPSMLREPPTPATSRTEAAYLAAAAEHLCAIYGLTPPAWVGAPVYFLDEAYWPESLGPAFEAICLAESPTAFRRRFIFTEAEPLRRKGGPRRPRKLRWLLTPCA